MINRVVYLIDLDAFASITTGVVEVEVETLDQLTPLH